MYPAPGKHPQRVMKKLGIKYTHAVPQSMGDQWWFFNCVNIPNPLPPYLEEAHWVPHECIGYGLSKQMADEIVIINNHYNKEEKCQE